MWLKVKTKLRCRRRVNTDAAPAPVESYQILLTPNFKANRKQQARNLNPKLKVKQCRNFHPLIYTLVAPNGKRRMGGLDR